MAVSGALSGSSPSGRAATRLAASRVDPGQGRTTVATILDELDADEPWRAALQEFCKIDGMPMRAQILGWDRPFDYMDRRMIAALRAAFEVAP